ncbi:MAG: putative baseplate assembly protein, partial [Acidimicrobiia bacterium]
LSVPAGTIVSTARTDQDDAIEFTTLEPLRILPCSLSRLVVEAAGTLADQTAGLRGRDGVQCFGPRPQPGDALYVGLSDAVPACAVVLRFGCEIEGVGVDPRHPPVVWEAWNGSAWQECDLEVDETGGFNQTGDVILHVPATHTRHSVGRTLAGWLRCRTVLPEEWQAFYSAAPRLTRLEAFTMGGTSAALNARIVPEETVGTSDGVPGQAFPLQLRPVVEAKEIPPDVETSVGTGWERWTPVEHFAGSGPDDLHFVLDEAAGEIRFGPAVQLPDGTMHRLGAAPPAGAAVRIRRYCTGGGTPGNVAAGALSVLPSSLPYIDRVENRRSAAGGVDGETMDNAKLRGSVAFRSRDRAVTSEDFEQLTRQAAVEVARVRCMENGDPDRRHAVTVLIVPHVVDGPHGAVALADLAPADELLGRVGRYLDLRRTVGTRVLIEPPHYLGITVVASLRCRAGFDLRMVEAATLDALYGYFHPVRGGPAGTGWPFGRPVSSGEVYSVLQRVPGLDYVEEVRLHPANPLDGRRGDHAERIDLEPNELIFSFGHQVRVRD